MKPHKTATLLVVALLALAGQTAMGQGSVTKSGTPVTPADRTSAAPALLRKSATPLPDPTAGTYVVVTREDLLTAIQPLIAWKRQEGFRVETLVMSTRESDSIRSALRQRYEGSTPLRPAQKYVLLVGDVDRLQACPGRYTPGGLSSSVTDLYYGEYTGDYVPEALVGRLSVADSGQLADVVAKIIAYEQGRWAAAERVLLTAGNESRDNAPTTTNGQVHYLANLTAEFRPELDTVCFYNPSSGGQQDTLVKALDKANALVNYTAHCTAQGWNSPAVTYATLDTLPNAVPTVFVNNCCLSNAFRATCFGERLLRKAEGGAVGVIGATNETLWDEDYYWAVGAKYPPTLHPTFESGRPGAFDGLLTGSRLDPDAVSLGALIYAGCSAVTLVGSPYDAFYWETYCLLGDPSMTLTMGSTDSLHLAVGDSIVAGMTLLHVESQPWSRISATQGGTLLGTVLTDSEGRGSLALTQGLAGDSLTLTATRPERIFRQMVLPINAPNRGRLAVTNAAASADGSRIELTLQNVGADTAAGHRLTLTQDSTDRSLGAALDAEIDLLPLPTLAPSEDTTLSLPLGDYSIGALPVLKGLLTLRDEREEAYALLPVALEMDDRRPRLTGLQLLDEGGRPMRKFVPGEKCTLQATLAAMADSAMLTINQLPVATSLDTDQLTAHYTTASTEERLHVELAVRKDRWQESYGGWLLAHNNMEDFESGDFSNYPWQWTTLNPWQIDSTTVHGGHYSARSATIGDAQRSTLTLEIETLADDSVTFYYRVSSEGSDWLYFFLDGRRRGYWSGNSGWQYYARALPAGKHTLQWIYQKDASRSERDDCAHVDDIRLPLAWWSQPYGHGVADSVGVGIAGGRNVAERFTISPNPAVGAVTLKHGARPYGRRLTIYDTYGRRVDEIKIEDNCEATQYLTHHLRFGIYTLVLHDRAGSQVRKLIVTK